MNRKTALRFGPSCLAGLLLGIGTVVGATEYDQKIEKEIQVSTGGTLSVQADRGSIEVNTDASDKVDVRVHRHIKGGSQAQADEAFANDDVCCTQDDSTLAGMRR